MIYLYINFQQQIPLEETIFHQHPLIFLQSSSYRLTHTHTHSLKIWHQNMKTNLSILPFQFRRTIVTTEYRNKGRCSSKRFKKAHSQKALI